MTTNVTHRRPERMPWTHHQLLFDPDELRRLFPERIVAWLETHPPPIAEGREGERRRRTLDALAPLRPLPDPDDLPVVVAARMSLSFPLLISAVPLHALDLTRERTREALAAVEKGDTPAHPLEAPVCWFSDGGITSNFPVHFFDTPLPTRPTFAIDLDGFHPDHPRVADEAKNVYLPSSNAGGLLDTWHRLDPTPGLGSVSGFLGGIVRTMQNHVDAALTHQPGYRDRIVHVHVAHDEGGMNLAMPPEVIEALTHRGQAAGRALVERFAETPGTAAGLSWDNHRWVRYRSALTAIAVAARAVRAGVAHAFGRRALLRRARRPACRPRTGGLPARVGGAARARRRAHRAARGRRRALRARAGRRRPRVAATGAGRADRPLRLSAAQRSTQAVSSRGPTFASAFCTASFGTPNPSVEP